MKPKIASHPEISQYIFTCSADNPEDFCVTYATNQEYVQRLLDSGKHLAVIVHKDWIIGDTPDNICFIRVDDPELEFILWHNWISKHEDPKSDYIADEARVHPLACIGADGMRYIKNKDGTGLINMKHMGCVVIREHAEIGPFSTIARATLDSTIIDKHARIGHGVYIGHNCKVGQRTIIVDGAIMGGSSEVGDDCWIGLNTTIKNGAKICSNVMIAMGAVLAKDIAEPGIYVGAPARRMGDWDGSW